ncbi:MAG: protein phosphatase 2C domain-containing protein [Gammaproteobacteria bacterium]|nr:protein phosphatase 2C domain-containing protein [Gammaproteobacteria bacterium]MDH5613792.1 protein phosphatase 2C domain-containing protein [Gammaproteobacteria bacterium]
MSTSFETSMINRLGNREKNEDRADIIKKDGAVMLVLADGMGGYEGGDLAAQVVVSTLSKRFNNYNGKINDVQDFLTQAIAATHQTVIEMGKRQNPPISPRSTCVVCIVQDGKASWAHVGDSRLYLIRDEKVLFRTRDNSYVEKLYQQGKITREEMTTHPMKNHLTECIGGDPTPPMITRGKTTQLQNNDIVMLCSDGLWGALSDNIMIKELSNKPLESAIDAMAENAEQITYPQSDNITVVALHWQQENHADEIKSTEPEITKEPVKSRAMDSVDKLDSAIDEIENTIKQFEHELKKS